MWCERETLSGDEREREIYFQAKHINIDMVMLCQFLQMARLDGDAMIITDLLPATPWNLVLILGSSLATLPRVLLSYIVVIL